MSWLAGRAILRRALGSAALLALIASAAPGASRAALRQVVITGTVDFVGCPQAISCASFPLMWGISGGEPVSARFVYDDASPLAFLDDQSPEYVEARYDHALPLAALLGVRVAFGPYAATVSGASAPAQRYAIHLFDDLESTCCPDLSESVSLELTVPDFSLTLEAPAGVHDLDLRVVRLDFLNFSGSDDLLNGPALPPDFAVLPWEQMRLTVDVYDPVAARAGRAFLTVGSLQASDVPAVPAISGWAMSGLIAGLFGSGFALLARAGERSR